MSRQKTGVSEHSADDDSARPSGRVSRRFSATARWTVVFAVVMIALVVAIWPRHHPSPDSTTGTTVVGPGAAGDQGDHADLARARHDAALPPCPTTGRPIGGHSVLAGVTEQCLGDGSAYHLGSATAGVGLVINMWAVWCLPCRQELPKMAAYARRAAGKVNVLAVHASEGAQNPYLALQFLIENGVRLPVVLDTDAHVAAAVGAPRVFPSTILVRPDGTVAKVLPQIFDDPGQIADAVHRYLGVST